MKNQEQRTRQYAALEALAIACGVQNPNGEKLYKKLRTWERKANKASLDYCNADLRDEQFSPFIEHVENEVSKIFNCKLSGFFVNTDPRGYALKIQDKHVRGEGKYSAIRIHQDFGGDGILAPDFS
jgi:hypothetical protein